MKIEEQFNLVAKEYDEGRRLFIPCFDDFYIGATDFVVRSIATPKRVLDLGAGTGLLTAFWYKYLPKAEYVLVDIADKMLDVAKRRFEGIQNISYEVLDYKESFPDKEFDTVISALSIHHLEHDEKRMLFRHIFEMLPDGSVFINYDQFCADTKAMSDMIDNYWVRGLQSSGLSQQELDRWRERQKLDRECSVSQELEWLKEADFSHTHCIYTNQKFSVLMAVK